MRTYWDFEKAGGLPSYLGHEYPTEFIKLNGEDCVVRVDITESMILLFDKQGTDGVSFAAQSFRIDNGLRQSVYDMVEIHADNWGI